MYSRLQMIRGRPWVYGRRRRRRQPHRRSSSLSEVLVMEDFILMVRCITITQYEWHGESGNYSGLTFRASIRTYSCLWEPDSIVKILSRVSRRDQRLGVTEETRSLLNQLQRITKRASERGVGRASRGFSGYW